MVKKSLTFLNHSKKNNWSYTSIKKTIDKRGKINKSNISMKSIKHWCNQHINGEV